MILEIKNGTFEVIENSCESVDKATIRLAFKDFTLCSSDNVRMLVNDKEIKKIGLDEWKFDFSLHNHEESKIDIIVERKDKTKIYYTKMMMIKKFICFGDSRDGRYEQVLLDQNEKIFKLEKRILEIEKKLSVF